MRPAVDRRPLLAAALMLVCAETALAQPAPAPRPPPGSQEDSRRKLLEQVGLDKQPATPPKPSEPPAEAQEPAPPPAGAPPAPGPATAPAAPAVVPFVGRVHQVMLTACRSCHVAGGMAAASRLVLDGNAAHDHAATRRLVDLGAPRRSLLLTKATGTQHGGGPTLTTSSDSYRRLLQWISGGAVLEARPPGDTSAPAAEAAATAGPRRPRVRAPAAIAGPTTPEAAPSAAPADTPVAVEAPAGTEAPAAPAQATPATPTPVLAPEAVALHAELAQACLACHREGGPAAMTRYKLTGQREGDLTASRAFVDLASPSTSVLVSKAAGQPHGGGAPWPPGSPGQKLLLAWIAAGAPDRAPPPPAAPAPEQTAAAPVAAAAPAPATAPPTMAPTPTGRPPHGSRASLTLFGNQFTLNGRFDLNLERRGFQANPWADDSQRALQSYHHFLFLGRQAADDPFVFTAELISLEFYEAGFRLGRGRHWGAHVRAGKLLVPFGNEPLFHQSYGGSAGFDQRVLPPVWAAEGLAASGHLMVAGATLSADLYGVRGYALRRADAVLNLQSDLSPADDARAAVGARLGAAFGALGGFYSAYFNPLGFDRRLFLQAIDLSVWRWPGVPVLDRLVLGMGLLRADVSGGGPGSDYYHFASYWLARVYALDWLYLQYRQGLRTFDNKRNLTYDARRAGPEDGSTHNFTLGTRYRGLTAGLSYFLNFEKADEVDDDLLRLWVALEF